jgi:hypothetical protein
VLAASATSPIQTLSGAETRKLFFGVPLEKNGTVVVPLLNQSDPMLYEVFLQQVTYMSAAAYEKQLRSVVYRLGGQLPESIADPAALLAKVRSNPNAVTYCWDHQLKGAPGICEVSTLWSGSID